MKNIEFITIHTKNQSSVISKYINCYEKGLNNDRFNWLQNEIYSTPYLSTIIKLIQAKQKGLNDSDAWGFFMDWSPKAVYESLKSIS